MIRSYVQPIITQKNIFVAPSTDAKSSEGKDAKFFSKKCQPINQETKKWQITLVLAFSPRFAF